MKILILIAPNDYSIAESEDAAQEQRITDNVEQNLPSTSFGRIRCPPVWMKDHMYEPDDARFFTNLDHSEFQM